MGLTKELSRVCAQERGVEMTSTEVENNKYPTVEKKPKKRLTKVEKEQLEIRRLVEESLKEQFMCTGQTGKYAENMLNDYMFFYDLKNKLQEDINTNGVRVSYTNGNGFKVEKDNASVSNLLKVNTQMLKILSDLNLKEPSILSSHGGGEPDDLLSRD